jgi:hypothetical protein
MFTKGGTQKDSGSIPGLPAGVTASQFFDALKKQVSPGLVGGIEELQRHVAADSDSDDDGECAFLCHGQWEQNRRLPLFFAVAAGVE